MRPTNQCGACREDFASVAAFDRHRVGVHAYTYSQGLKLEPMREDGRRCMDAREMRGKGLERNAKGLWYDVAGAARIQRHFADA